MSRQAGSIVRGFQSRAGYPSMRAGSRWRLCTAKTAKGQAGREPSTRLFVTHELAGTFEIKDLVGEITRHLRNAAASHANKVRPGLQITKTPQIVGKPLIGPPTASARPQRISTVRSQTHIAGRYERSRCSDLPLNYRDL